MNFLAEITKGLFNLVVGLVKWTAILIIIGMICLTILYSCPLCYAVV